MKVRRNSARRVIFPGFRISKQPKNHRFRRQLKVSPGGLVHRNFTSCRKTIHRPKLGLNTRNLDLEMTYPGITEGDYNIYMLGLNISLSPSFSLEMTYPGITEGDYNIYMLGLNISLSPSFSLKIKSFIGFCRSLVDRCGSLGSCKPQI